MYAPNLSLYDCTTNRMTFCDDDYYLKNSASRLCFGTGFLRQVNLSFRTTISLTFKGNNIILGMLRGQMFSGLKDIL